MALALDENKKKVFLLAGIAGLLGIGAVVLLLPKGGGTDATTASNTTAVTTSPASSGDATSEEGAGAGGAPSSTDATGTGATGATTTGAIMVAAAPYRTDPFIPFFTKPLPPPTPRPTPRPLPTLPPPADIPPPVDIPAPRGGGGVSPYPLPSLNSSGRRTNALVGLPGARIPRLTNVPTAPRVQIAPPNVGGGSQPALERSPNKRLAGVVIGDSVRALLEVEDATATGGASGGDEYGAGAGQAPPKTYIVQPGQEIPEEGIKVLRIERTTEAGRTRVRMVVRENNVIRYIDLRQGNTQNAAGGADGRGGGASGFPGGGGGFPGGGGGFPGGGGGFPGGGRGGP